MKIFEYNFVKFQVAISDVNPFDINKDKRLTIRKQTSSFKMK